jgi:hypothetical protein
MRHTTSDPKKKQRERHVYIISLDWLLYDSSKAYCEERRSL